LGGINEPLGGILAIRPTMKETPCENDSLKWIDNEVVDVGVVVCLWHLLDFCTFLWPLILWRPVVVLRPFCGVLRLSDRSATRIATYFFTRPDSVHSDFGALQIIYLLTYFIVRQI